MASNYSLAMLYAMRNGTLQNSERKFESRIKIFYVMEELNTFTSYIPFLWKWFKNVFHQSKRVTKKWEVQEIIKPIRKKMEDLRVTAFHQI